MRKKRKEARLLSYSLLYDKSGKLITERTSTDIKELEKFFTPEEYQTLRTVHNHIESCLNSRIMNSK